MSENDQHNPSSYAEVILLSNDASAEEFKNQAKSEPRRFISGMFSSISDAELMTQTLGFEASEDSE